MLTSLQLDLLVLLISAGIGYYTVRLIDTWRHRS